MSRGGWTAVGAGALALASGTAFATTQYIQRATVGAMEPAAGSAVASKRPLIALTPQHADRLTDITVTVDGKDRTSSVGRDAEGRIVVPTSGLADGTHTVDVRFSTRNVFSRTVRRTWDFTVDTTQPKLAVTSPKPGAEVGKRTVALAGRSEAGAGVSVTWKGGTATGTAGPDGAWTISAPLPEGAVAMKVTARDPAGNATVATRSVVVDTTAPRLTVAKLPKVSATAAPVIYGAIAGEKPERALVGATVNGRDVVPIRAGGTLLDGSSAPTVAFDGTKFSMSVGDLPEGLNKVTVFAKDPAGNRTTKAMTVLVDSTEDLGTRDIIAGARGADVKALQRSLIERGFVRTKVTGVYDARTTRSVRNYQRVRKIKQSGVFGPRTREAFVGRIVVSISKRRLQLIRDGKVVKTYRVAVGMAAYPTPVGSFSVVNKERDPTWTPPPDSDWAKGLGPIPPGPGNPLGTRWIGTSAPAVGIHGTYADSSIGTAASHGCIRMHIKDVEALYEQVTVGMPVLLKA